MINFKLDGIEYRFFDHLYAVSRCGKVLRKMAPYTPTARGDGYLALGRERLMHRVIATCWVKNPTGAKHVHHINGNKSDNRADNLEWLTPKEHFRGKHHRPHIGPMSEATKRKLREGRLGAKDSRKTRKKKAKILAIYGPKTPCRFGGVDYPSVAAGARAAQIPNATFRQRCLSKNFPEYELL